MNGPREVFQRFIQTGRDGDVAARAALFAPDGVMEFPFAPAGVPRRFEGHEEIRDVLTKLSDWSQRHRLRIKEDGSHVVVHDTSDPEVIITEIDLLVETPDAGDTVHTPYIQVWRVRDGQIVTYRDYWGAATADFVAAAYRSVP